MKLLSCFSFDPFDAPLGRPRYKLSGAISMANVSHVVKPALAPRAM